MELDPTRSGSADQPETGVPDALMETVAQALVEVLPKSVRQNPEGIGWLHEPAWDDARLLAHVVLAAAWEAQVGLLCGQCGEQPAAMVKVGTHDGWCVACLDEAAEPEPAAQPTDRYGNILCDCHNPPQRLDKHDDVQPLIAQARADERRKVQRETWCRCHWCCQSTPPEKRGEGHWNCYPARKTTSITEASDG